MTSRHRKLVRQNKIARGTSDRLVHLNITETAKWSEKLKASGHLTCDQAFFLGKGRGREGVEKKINAR